MEVQRKKVLLIIPELIVGGAQRSFSKLSIELARHHEVSIAIFNRNLPIAYPYGGTLYSLDANAGGDIISKATALFSRVIKLKALKRKLKPHASISFLEGADYINVLSRIGEKIILSVRGSKLHDETMRKQFHGWRTKLFIPCLYKKANHIVVVNNGIEKELHDHFNLSVPTTIIYNFYSPTEIARLASEPLSSSLTKTYQSPVIVATGRLAVEKGLSFLIKIFSLVRKSSDARLVLVGDGPEYDKLTVLCKELGLSVQGKDEVNENAAVVFAGNQTNVFPFIQGATVSVLASSSEGFPNSLVEAMFCGVPVIAADCPYGPREILTRDTAVKNLVEPELAEFGMLMPLPSENENVMQTWSSAVASMLTDQSLRERYHHAGQRRAVEFSADEAIAKWLEIIK